MNILAIIGLIFLMNYSKSSLQKNRPLAENKLLQVKQVFLQNFSQYLIKKQTATNIQITKSIVGISEDKKVFLNFKYTFTNTADQTQLSKTARVIIEPTPNTQEWVVKKVISNTEEIKFTEDFIINL